MLCKWCVGWVGFQQGQWYIVYHLGFQLSYLGKTLWSHTFMLSHVGFLPCSCCGWYFLPPLHRGLTQCTLMIVHAVGLAVMLVSTSATLKIFEVIPVGSPAVPKLTVTTSIPMVPLIEYALVGLIKSGGWGKVWLVVVGGIVTSWKGIAGGCALDTWIAWLSVRSWSTNAFISSNCCWRSRCCWLSWILLIVPGGWRVSMACLTPSLTILTISVWFIPSSTVILPVLCSATCTAQM